MRNRFSEAGSKIEDISQENDTAQKYFMMTFFS